MINDSRNALVVEGGGMRGAFTCGVLDAFLQQRIDRLRNLSAVYKVLGLFRSGIERNDASGTAAFS